MPVQADAATRAANTRLWLATACASLTVTSVVMAMIFSHGVYAITALMIVALFAFISTIALVLSARREERIHGLLGSEPPPKRLELEGVDGTVDRIQLG